MKWTRDEHGTYHLEGPMGAGFLYKDGDLWVGKVGGFTSPRWMTFNENREWVRAAVNGEWVRVSKDHHFRLLHGGQVEATRDGLGWKYTLTWKRGGFATEAEAMSAAGYKIAKGAMQ